MTWYLYHQQAKDIIAQRQREADQIRLARLAQLDQEGGSSGVPRPLLAGPRRALAGVILAVGRSATRLATALDADADRTSETA